MKPFIIAALLLFIGFCTYKLCQERDPWVVGTIETQHVSRCIASYESCTSSYNQHTKTTDRQCSTHCSQYMCQEHTVKIGKHIWNDETLSVKDLYSGRCK